MLKVVIVESLHYILTAQLKYLSQWKPRNLPYQRKRRPCCQRVRAWPEPISSDLTARASQWQCLIEKIPNFLKIVYFDTYSYFGYS